MAEFHGSLDGFNDETIIGWAYDNLDSNNPTLVDCYIDDNYYCTIVSNFYRPDLMKAGYGNGNYAFFIKIPKELIDNQDKKVSIKIRKYNQDLHNSPKIFKFKRASSIKSYDLINLRDLVNQNELLLWSVNKSRPISKQIKEKKLVPLIKTLIVSDNYKNTDSKLLTSEFMEVPEVVTVAIRNCSILPWGVVAISNKYVLEESYNYLGFDKYPYLYLQKPNSLYWRKEIQSLVKIEKPVVHIMFPGVFNYYHWLIDTLPQIQVWKTFKKLQNIPILINKKFFSDPINIGEEEVEKRLQTLKYLSYDNMLIVDADMVECSLAYIPSVNTQIYHHYFNLFEEIKSYLEIKNSKENRLYITRKNASVRRVINEEEVINLLKNYDFNIIELEKMSFIEQAKLFASASLVVGPHGAGFSNLVFSSKKITFLEFINEFDINRARCFRRLASPLEHNHILLVCQPYNPRPNQDADLIVDIDKLENIINNVLN